MTRGPHLATRLAMAVTAGIAIWLAFPTHDRWYAAWLGTALLSYAGWAAGFRHGLLVGMVAGLASFVPTLSWSGVFVGKLPWFALATLEALYVAAMVAVVGWLQRRLVDAGRGWAAYAVVPVGWVVSEWGRGTTPFGGFPWARLAFSQADSPLAPIMAIGGAPLLTAAVAMIGVLIHVACAGMTRNASRVQILAAPITAATLAFAPLLIPLQTSNPADAARSARVAFVQGNVPKAGLDFNAERRVVLDNHVRATEALAATAAAENEPVDLVVWPENAADIDPLRNADAADGIARAQRAMDAPLLLGAILDEPAPAVSNASLLYRGDGRQPERYIKQHPVPFAEYIPYRSFFRRFNDKVDLVRVGFARGDRPVAFQLSNAAGRDFAAIPVICFEVAYDGLVRAGVDARSDLPGLLVVQTNNATFGFTAESEQQFAISRLRAIEHGRSVVHVSTVGVSGFIDAAGEVIGSTTDLYTQAVETADLALLDGRTVADRIGRFPEFASLGALIVAFGLGRRRRRLDNDPNETSPDAPKELVSA